MVLEHYIKAAKALDIDIDKIYDDIAKKSCHFRANPQGTKEDAQRNEINHFFLTIR